MEFNSNVMSHGVLTLRIVLLTSAVQRSSHSYYTRKMSSIVQPILRCFLFNYFFNLTFMSGLRISIVGTVPLIRNYLSKQKKPKTL